MDRGGWGVVTSAVVNYRRTQRSNGRFRTISRFSELGRRGMMGIVCLDARRLSGRDVMPRYRRSPYCPSIRGFMSTARRIFNDGGPNCGPWWCAPASLPQGLRLDVTLWQEMSTKLNQRLQIYRRSTAQRPRAPIIGQYPITERDRSSQRVPGTRTKCLILSFCKPQLCKNDRRRSSWWRRYSKNQQEDCRARDHCSRRCYNICKSETSGQFQGGIRTFSIHVCGD